MSRLSGIGAKVVKYLPGFKVYIADVFEFSLGQLNAVEILKFFLDDRGEGSHPFLVVAPKVLTCINEKKTINKSLRHIAITDCIEYLIRLRSTDNTEERAFQWWNGILPSWHAGRNAPCPPVERDHMREDLILRAGNRSTCRLHI